MAVTLVFTPLQKGRREETGINKVQQNVWKRGNKFVSSYVDHKVNYSTQEPTLTIRG